MTSIIVVRSGFLLTSPTERFRSRTVIAIVGLAVIATGLAARFLLAAPIGDILGGMLYAALIYLLVLLIAPRLRIAACLAATLVWTVGVEFLQLTPWPTAAAAAWWPSRLVLGTEFAWLDLATAVAGALATAAIDRALLWGPPAFRHGDES